MIFLIFGENLGCCDLRISFNFPGRKSGYHEAFHSKTNNKTKMGFEHRFSDHSCFTMPVDWGFIPSRVILKTLKIVFAAFAPGVRHKRKCEGFCVCVVRHVCPLTAFNHS